MPAYLLDQCIPGSAPAWSATGSAPDSLGGNDPGHHHRFLAVLFPDPGGADCCRVAGFPDRSPGRVGWAGCGANCRLDYADVHSHLWWPDLFIVALGAVLLAISFVRSEQKPVLASVMLAYGFFLPISAAGLGLASVDHSIWPNGLLVFLVHLTLAVLVGGIILVAMHFKPIKTGGYILPAVRRLAFWHTLVIFTGLVTLIRDGITSVRRVEPTPTCRYPLGIHRPVSGPHSCRPPSLQVQHHFTSRTLRLPRLMLHHGFILAAGQTCALSRAGFRALHVSVMASLVQVLPEIQKCGHQLGAHGLE